MTSLQDQIITKEQVNSYWNPWSIFSFSFYLYTYAYTLAHSHCNL